MSVHPRIEESEAGGTVAIDDVVIRGFVMTETACPKCGQSSTVFDFDHDAQFCPQLNEWIEPACSDARCEFCSNRPARPLERFR